MEYRCGSCAWSGGSDRFAGWTLEGCAIDAGGIRLDHDGSTATSPWVTPDFAPAAAIASWNCRTPARAGVEVRLQVRFADGSQSSWFSMGRWSSEPDVERGSVAGQACCGVSIQTDTLVSDAPFASIRVRVVAYGDLTESVVTLRRTALCWSDPKPAVWSPAPVVAGGEQTVIAGVPECSQMVYPNGGNVWCSPVSLSMVIGYWNAGTACAPLIEQTRVGVFDPVYGGYGNWAFNAAWAGSLGFVAQVVRFASLDAARRWIDAGVPLILSVSWDNGGERRLTGAPVKSSKGHLTVLVGFDGSGRAIMNEPASPDDGSVRRTYAAGELEACWLTASGGVAYLVYPPDHRVPELGGGYTVSTAS
ncbi:MAG: peptidase C39 family protein [Spirochaetaceae bacterium]|nr:MAG: peptidase C39 family protein [Spirochaetaceae bacterium]